MFLLGVLLVVFPLGSYLYLRAGFAYQLDSWDEIEALGPIGDLVEYERPDTTIDIVFFEPVRTDDSVSAAIGSLHEAFDDSPHVRFVALGEGSVHLLQDDRAQYASFPFASTPTAFAKTSAPFSEACANVPVAQRAYTVDTRGQVRRCYNLHHGRDVNRLVEQVALILPRGVKEDVILERNNEL